jgi:hypothetical protein
MRTLLVAALMTAIAAPAAHAQMPGTGIPLNQEREISPEQQAKRKATEDAYKSTMKGIPDAKPVDPWGNMRSTDTSAGNAAKAKPAAKKSTGTGGLY